MQFMTTRIKTRQYHIITFLFLLVPSCYVKAQEFYYSQYEHTPLNINPALISTDHDIKLSLLYHQNDFLREFNMKNFQFSFNYPLNLAKNDDLPQSLALSVFYNNTGKQGIINFTGGSISFSQGVRITNRSFLSAGIQASDFLFSNTNPGNYTTGSQWIQGTGFDPSHWIEENISYENISIFNINAGINWHITDGFMPKGNFGASVFYLNKPKYSFLDKKSSLETKYTVYGDYRIFKVRNFSVSPRFLYVHQNFNLISLGTSVKYFYKSDNPFLLIRDCSLQLGVDYRYDHTGIINFSIEQSKYLFGLSYALGLNSNKVYSNYGSNIEVCLVLKFKKNKRKEVKSKEYNIGNTRLVFNSGPVNNQGADNVTQNNIDSFKSDSLQVTGEKYRVQLRQDFKFKFNDAALTVDAHSYLDDLAKMLKQNTGLKVEVIGHTDDVGTEETNLKISQQRAQVVIDYLISKGINISRLKLTAKGKSEPLFPNNSEENRGKNRRVEFIIYSE